MIRVTRLPVLIVVTSLIILVVVGCQSRHQDSVSEGVVPKSVAGEAASRPAKVGELFQHWPKNGFQGALLISGEQIGYLEPCGCTAGQRGGLARRLDLIQKLEAQGWNLAMIDLGSLINDPNTHGGPHETRIRYKFALKALEMMGYNALALSTTDLKLGVDQVLTQYMNDVGETLRIVVANVKPMEGLDEKFATSIRTDVGSVKVGVTAVIDDEAFEALTDPAKDDLLTFRDPNDALGEVLADFERDTHMQVLMVQGSPEAARRYARDNPGFEVVVSTSQFVEPPRDVEVLNDGKTQLISVGKKGQFVGVLGLYQDPKQKFRYERIDLKQRFNSKTEAMRKLIDEDFVDQLAQEKVLETYPRHAYVHGDSPSDATYVGAETCKSCHPNTYAKWSTTKHAHAYDALTSNPKRNREQDAQCVSCHTTGFEYLGGFVTADRTPALKGNQCENCHGPASKHVASPDDADFRRAIARTAEDADKNFRCIQCHTEDDSPDFNFAKYWPKILHRGLDTYDDPKVHRGLEPEQIAHEIK